MTPDDTNPDDTNEHDSRVDERALLLPEERAAGSDDPEAQAAAIGALSTRMGLSPVLANTLQLMAKNRRLFVLPQLTARLAELIATERGEVTADVTSAIALTDAQMDRLKQTLAEKSGKTVKLNTRVDETLIGGMIVKLGSQMIDSSVRSKLASLQNVMKEVG